MNKKYMCCGAGVLLGILLELLAYVFGSCAVGSTTGIGMLFFFWSFTCAVTGLMALVAVAIVTCVLISDDLS